MLLLGRQARSDDERPGPTTLVISFGGLPVSFALDLALARAEIPALQTVKFDPDGLHPLRAVARAWRSGWRRTLIGFCVCMSSVNKLRLSPAFQCCDPSFHKKRATYRMQRRKPRDQGTSTSSLRLVFNFHMLTSRGAGYGRSLSEQHGEPQR